MPCTLLSPGRWVGIAVAAALLCAAPSAVARPVLQDSVTGSGGTTNGCTLTFDAHSGPSGEHPSGTVRCPGFFHGPVTCLGVQGHVALLTVDTPEFGGVGLQVTDNGGAGADGVAGIPIFTTGCAATGTSYYDLGFTGDVVVTDALPPPTSQSQCLHHGWVRYGFDGREQCIKYVKHHHHPG